MAGIDRFQAGGTSIGTLEILTSPKINVSTVATLTHADSLDALAGHGRCAFSPQETNLINIDRR